MSRSMRDDEDDADPVEVRQSHLIPKVGERVSESAIVEPHLNVIILRVSRMREL